MVYFFRQDDSPQDVTIPPPCSCSYCEHRRRQPLPYHAEETNLTQPLTRNSITGPSAQSADNSSYDNGEGQYQNHSYMFRLSFS